MISALPTSRRYRRHNYQRSSGLVPMTDDAIAPSQIPPTSAMSPPPRPLGVRGLPTHLLAGYAARDGPADTPLSALGASWAQRFLAGILTVFSSRVGKVTEYQAFWAENVRDSSLGFDQEFHVCFSLLRYDKYAFLETVFFINGLFVSQPLVICILNHFSAFSQGWNKVETQEKYMNNIIGEEDIVIFFSTYIS